MSNTKFIIIYDTYCGWCYGAHPVFNALIESGADVETYHRHLFVGANAHKLADGFGAQAETYDARIGQMSGQPFSQAYIEKNLRSDTEILNSSLTAQAAHIIHDHGAKAELALAARLQKDRYVDGVSAANRDAVVTALVSEGILPETAHRIGTPDLVRDMATTTAKAVSWMEAVGGRGVPTIVKAKDGNMMAVDASSFLGRPSDIMSLAD